MNLIGERSPRFSYTLRTALRQAAFPFRPPKTESAPTVRDDLDSYAWLYREASANFEGILSPYQSEIRWPLARVYNGFFETIDAELYYCMIRFFKPKRVIEVGAGNSTWFARDALKANGGGRLCAIDPAPRLPLPRECDHLKSVVQEVDLAVFRELEANDILFIDSSHTAGEAIYDVESIYPSLRAGVFIHHHDTVFPFLGYTSFVPNWKSLGEQEVILRFVRQHRDSYEIFTSSAFAHYEEPAMVHRLVPSKRYKPQIAGGSTWIRKKA